MLDQPSVEDRVLPTSLSVLRPVSSFELKYPGWIIWGAATPLPIESVLNDHAALLGSPPVP